MPSLWPLGPSDWALWVNGADFLAWPWANASYEPAYPGLRELAASDVWATAAAGVLYLEDRAGRRWFELPLSAEQNAALVASGRLLLLPLSPDQATLTLGLALALLPADDDEALAQLLTDCGLEGLGLTCRS